MASSDSSSQSTPSLARYALVLPNWPTYGTAGGIAMNFRHTAEALHREGRLRAVWVIDPNVPFWRRESQLPGVDLPVVVLPCGLGPVRGKVLLRYLLGVTRMAWSLTRHRREFGRVVATNYMSMAALYVRLPWAHPVMTRVSTTAEQADASGPPATSRWARFRHRVRDAWDYAAIRGGQLKASHTQAHIAWLSQRLDLPQAAFDFVPHGIQSTTIRRLPWVAPRLLLFVGRLEPRKGTDILLPALGRILKAFPDTRAVLVGRDMGDYQSTFAGEFAGVANTRIQFLGQISDAERDAYLDECYALVSPARYESFGLTYLEAMTRGKPVIGCTGSGSVEVIGAGGLVVPPGEIEPLVGAMDRLLREPALYEELAQGALRQAEKFDITETVRALDRAFCRHADSGGG